MNKRWAITLLAALCLLMSACQGGSAVAAPPIEDSVAPSPAYHSISASSDGLREVVVKHADGTYSYGFIDEEGNQVLAPRLDGARDFINGQAVVLEDGRWKQIDRTGKVLQLLDDAYVNVHSFDGHDGVASNSKGMSAIIGADGQPRCEFAYRSIWRYGLNPSLFLATKDPEDDEDAARRWSMSWSKYGLLSPEGVELTPFVYYISGGGEGDGSYPVLFPVRDGNKHGYLDENGAVKMPLIYDNALPFDNGRGWLWQNSEDGSSGKYALVDRDGFLTDFIFESVYGLIYAFHEGYAVVEIEGKTCLINDRGEIEMSAIGEPIAAGHFEHGYLVCAVDGQEQVIENPLMQQRTVNIYIDGHWLYTDVEPAIVEGRTLAPLRAITEALGYRVQWDANTGTATIQNEQRIIRLTLGSDQVSVNVFDDGVPAETVILDVPAQVVDGRTLVPVRFLAENIGAKVTWDNATKTVNIATDGI
ncbi:MAG: stalk domain-containing protein [Syntrophomonadaceae bacterium]|nr:stalk domain-containing protein [Syntrophomonadaceae bacterium]